MMTAAVIILTATTVSCLLSWRLLRLLRSFSFSGKGVFQQCQTFTSHYPHFDPIGGLDLLVQMWKDYHRNDLSEGMRRRHEKYGDTFVTRNLGEDCVYTIDPENIRTITTGRFDQWGKSAWVGEASKHIGNGVLLNDGPAWKTSRTTLRPIFARREVNEPALLEPHIQDLFTAIREAGSDGRAFDFQQLSTRLSLDVVTDFLFGEPTSSLVTRDENTEGRHFLSLVRDFEPASGSFMAVGILAWLELLPCYGKLIKTLNGMKAFFINHLNSIMQCPDCSRQTAWKSCLSLMEAEGWSMDKIRGELQNIFFASFDTTATLLSNLIEILSRRQDIQDRLREEIAGLDGRLPVKEDLAKLPYLHEVLWETLRLFTPVTFHTRRARVDTTLPHGGGPDGASPVFVRAGTTVIWSIYSLNRNPKHYGADWADFRPERWESRPSSPASSHAKGCRLDEHAYFMPFGSGPRSCMGQHMVQAELTYVLVRLLQEVSVLKAADLRPFREAKAVSYYNRHGTLVCMS